MIVGKVSVAAQAFLSRWEQIFGAEPSTGADASHLSFFAAFRAAAGLPAAPDDAPAAAAAAEGARARPMSALGLANAAPSPAAAPVAGALLAARPDVPVAMVYADPAAMSVPLLFTADTRELLTGGIDAEGLGAGDGDQLVVGGAIDGPFALDPAADWIEEIVLTAGNSYALSAADANVAAGRSFTVTATGLGAGHTIDFDGSAESDGRFLFYGGAGRDGFAGGAGDDLVYGLGGGDILAGGGGADIFAYTGASESTGAGFDTLLDFDFGEDRIDLPTAVTGFAGAVTAGALSLDGFDADLAAALGAALGAGQAVLFTADGGDFAGETFLIVDGNGEAGYQAGEDYVFLLAAPPADPIADPGIFV